MSETTLFFDNTGKKKEEEDKKQKFLKEYNMKLMKIRKSVSVKKKKDQIKKLSE